MNDKLKERKMRQLSVRMTVEEYEDLNKLAHLEFKQKAQVTHALIKKYIEKNIWKIQ